jgi:hypothetical protein
MVIMNNSSKQWYMISRDHVFRVDNSIGKIFLSVILIVLSSFFSYFNAQRDLKMVVDEATSILGELGGNTSKVERATLTKEDERTVTISLTLSGFDDKNYKVKAAMLNKTKKPIEEIPPVEADVPKSKQMDIALNLADAGKTMAANSIESKYLLIRVVPNEGGLSSLLEDAIGDVNLNGSEFLFELDKKWLLMGANVKVNVKLVPYKSAAAISPN